MIKVAYKPAKPDRAGKNYRPKEESRHVFFFKGHNIIISQDFRDVWICKRRIYFPTHCNTLDDALVQAMEEIYKLNDKDYENELQRIAEEEKEKQIRKQLAPFINTMIKELQQC